MPRSHQLQIVILCASLQVLVSSQFLVGQAVPPEKPASPDRELVGEEKFQTLKMMADRLHDNFDHLKTWSGEYEFFDKFAEARGVPSKPPEGDSTEMNSLDRWQEVIGELTPESPVRKGRWTFQTGRLQFSVDYAAGKIHSYADCVNPVGYIDVATGRQVRMLSSTRSEECIETPEDLWEFHPSVLRPQLLGYPEVSTVASQGGPVAFRFGTKRRFGLSSGAIDVRRFAEPGEGTYGDVSWKNYKAPSSRLLWIVLALRDNAILPRRNEYVEKLSIYTNSADPPQIRIEHRDGNEATIYDGNAGFNITAWRRLTESQTVEYRKVDGLFIPDSYEDKFQWSYKGENFERHKVCRLVHCQVNEAIPAEEFQLNRSRLTYGTRLMDEVKDRLFVFDGTDFVPAEEFVPDPSRLAVPKPSP